MDADVFLRQFKQFLTRSRVNLGTQSPARDRFIETAMGRLTELLKPSAAEVTPGRDSNRILHIKSPKLSLGPGGLAQMTAQGSELADRECGYGGGR
jgi:hypothetical protein